MIDGARVLERLAGRLPAVLGDDPRVWVVGGAVRDVLLGREPREVDLVVEGDAAAVAVRLGAPEIVHERFGTLRAGGLDLAAARRERYPRPGALPDVEAGAEIDEDLARRDFTVNTFAVRLADGEARAHAQASADLAARRLRVLHDRSFLDDPTRLLRLARYSARLGFEPEERTERLARAAMRAGALGTVSGPRLGDELRRLLEEPLPAALERLAELGVAEALLPGFAPRALTGQEGAVALAACCLDVPDLAGRLDGLGFTAAERDAITAAATRAPGLAARLREAGTASDIVRAARGERPETVALAGALGAAEAARRWLEELRHARLAITGEDLVAAGLQGPAVGRGLRAAMEAMVDGEAPDREAQLQAARLASSG